MKIFPGAFLQKTLHFKKKGIYFFVYLVGKYFEYCQTIKGYTNLDMHKRMKLKRKFY
jgi:hypothetical protein